MEALYVTGHSLGGAMAALMGVMLATDPDYHRLADKLKGVYTFGQPMIGDPEFAQACDAHPILKKVMARYVFEHDIVPELPPVASGRFAHFGTEYRLASDCHGDAKPAPATTQLTHLGSILGAPLAFLAHQLHALRDVPLQHSLYDHGPQHYIAALTPRHVRSEFGD